MAAPKRGKRARADRKTRSPKRGAKAPATEAAEPSQPVAPAASPATAPVRELATARYENEGHRLICELGASSGEVAREIGVSAAAVRYYRRPVTPKMPSPEVQAALERAYGIARRAWTDQPKTPGSPAAAVPSPRVSAFDVGPAASVPGSSLDEAEYWLALSSELRRRYQDPEVPEFDRPTLREVQNAADQALKFLKFKSQLQGESRSDEEKLAKSPRWAAIRRVIAKTLAKYPAVSEELETALRDAGLL